MLKVDGGNIGIGTASPDSNYKITTSGGGIKAENSSASQPAGYFSNAGGGPAITANTGGITLGGVNRTSWPAGTVTSVATNNGLTGGTITTSGTIGLNTASLSAGSASTGKVYWDGSKLVSGTDQTGGGGGITGSGTNGYIPKWTSSSALGSSVIQESSGIVVWGDIDTQGSAYKYKGTDVITAKPSSNNYFFGNSGNLAMTGVQNIAGGLNAIHFNTSGNSNVAYGVYALYQNTTGGNNTGHGSRALYYNTTGSNNTAIGSNAGTGSGALNNATAIGYSAIANTSNEVRIGNTAVTKIGGQVGWSIGSDIRLKHDIKDSNLGLEFINKLRPVSYKLNNGDGGINYGFIAQEVESAVGVPTNIVSTDDTPEKMKTMRYNDLIAPLVKAVQEQQKQIQGLEAQVEMLKK